MVSSDVSYGARSSRIIIAFIYLLYSNRHDPKKQRRRAFAPAAFHRTSRNVMYFLYYINIICIHLRPSIPLSSGLLAMSTPRTAAKTRKKPMSDCLRLLGTQIRTLGVTNNKRLSTILATNSLRLGAQMDFCNRSRDEGNIVHFVDNKFSEYIVIGQKWTSTPLPPLCPVNRYFNTLQTAWGFLGTIVALATTCHATRRIGENLAAIVVWKAATRNSVFSSFSRS